MKPLNILRFSFHSPRAGICVCVCVCMYVCVCVCIYIYIDGATLNTEGS